jgi:hypothetical protein
MTSYNDGILNSSIPHENFVERYINIDSRDRDRRFHQNTNNYKVDLKNVLYGVKKVELVSAEIPKSEYFLDQNNNSIEMLIDPVLFSSSTPSATQDNIHIQRADNASDLLYVLRVDNASGTQFGVIQGLLPSTTESTTKSSNMQFNASRTAHISSDVLFYNNNETVIVVAYSEPDNNNGASCRVIIIKKDGSVSPSQISFGSEFGIERIFNSDQRSVFQKVLSTIDSRRFALLYNCQGNELKVLIGSSGIDKDDVDTRRTNGTMFGLNIQEYSHFKVNASICFVAYITETNGGTFHVKCRLVNINTDYSLLTGSETIIETSTRKIQGIDSVGQSDKVIVSYVNESVLRVSVLNLIDSSIVPISSSNFASRNYSGLTGTDGTSNIVDPRTTIRWANDCFYTFTIHIRLIDDSAVLFVDDSPFSSITLKTNESYRFNMKPHPLETRDVSTYITLLEFYMSETSSTKYSQYVGAGTTSVKITTPSDNTILYYGLANDTSRGRVVVQSFHTYSTPFYLFTSGSHNVGNRPYTYTSNSKNSRNRSVHNGYQQIGGVTDAISFSISDSDYVLTRGELWLYHNNQWSYLFGGGESTDSPCPRNGGTGVVKGNKLFIFGGIGHQNPQTNSVDTENISFHHNGDNIKVKNLRNSKSRRLIEYEISFKDSVIDGTIQFKNLSDVHNDLIENQGGWHNLTDLSSFFNEITYGLLLTSNQDSTTKYTNFINPVESFSLEAGSLVFASSNNQCPNISGYSFSVLVYPHVDKVDNSNQFQFNYSVVSITIYVITGSGSKTMNYDVPVDTWSMIEIDILSTDTFIQNDLSNIEIKITVEKMLLHTGYIGIKQAQIFPTEINVASSQRDGQMNVNLKYLNNELTQVASATLGRGDTTPPRYLNDMWSLNIDPYFMSKLAIVNYKGGIQNTAPTDIHPVVPTGNVIHDISVVNDSYHVITQLTGVTAGSRLLNKPSLHFSGSSVVELLNSKQPLKEIRSGDYTISVLSKITPRIGYIIVNTKSLTVSNSISNGPLISEQYNVSITNTSPANFVASTSLMVSPNTHILFESSVLPASIVIAFFIYIPSNTSGKRHIFNFINYINFYIDENNNIVFDDVIITTCTTDQWVQYAIVSTGGLNSLYENGELLTTTVITRVVNTVLQMGNSTTLWTGSNILINSFCVFDSSIAPNNSQSLVNGHAIGCRAGDQYIWSAKIPTGLMGVRVSINSCIATLPNGDELSIPLETIDIEKTMTIILRRRGGTVILSIEHDDVIYRSEQLNSSTFELVTSNVILGGSLIDDSNFYNIFLGNIDEFQITQGYSLSTISYETFNWTNETYSIENDNGLTPQLTPRAYHSMQIDDASNIWIFGGMSLSSTCSDLWVIPFQRPFVASFLSGNASGISLPTDTHPGSRVHASLMTSGTNLYLFGGEVYENVGPFYVQAEIVKIISVQGTNDVETGTVIADYSGGGPTMYLYPIYTSRQSVLLEDEFVIWIQISLHDDPYYVFMIPTGAGGTVNLTEIFKSVPSDSLPILNESDLSTSWTSVHPMITPSRVFADLWSYNIGTAQWELLNDGKSAPAPGARSRTNAFYTSDKIVLMTGYYALDTFVADVWVVSEENSWSWNRKNTSLEPLFSLGTDAYPGIINNGIQKVPAWISERTVKLVMNGVLFTNQLDGLLEEINAHHGLVIHGNVEWVGSSANITFTNKETVVPATTFPGGFYAENASFIDNGSFIIQYTDAFAYININTPIRPGLSYFPDQISNAGEELIIVEAHDTQIVFNYNVLTLELVRGITYRFRVTGDSQISFSMNSQTVLVETIFDSSYLLRTNDLPLGNIVLKLGELDTVLSVVDFQSILSNYDLPFDNTKRIIVHHTTKLQTLIPTALVLNPTFYVRNDTGTSPQAQINLSFQDNANNRYGTFSKITYNDISKFSADTPIVFSTTNPTTEIACSDALFSRSIHAFSSENGLNCLLNTDNDVGQPMFANEVSVFSTEIQLMSDETDEIAHWLLLFLYEGTDGISGRAIFQRATSSDVDILVQNMIGEVITFTDPLSIFESNIVSMDMSCFNIGERSGDCIIVFYTGTELLYRDVSSADSDPLTSTAAPGRRTTAFSLLESEGLISNESTDQFKVLTTGIIDGVSGSTILSSFVVVYVTINNSLVFRTFSYDSNVYIGEQPVIIMSSATNYILEGIQMRDSDEMLVKIQELSGFRVIRCSIKSGQVSQNISIPVDNTNTLIKSTSIITNSKFVGISVHTSSVSEIAPVTVRTFTSSSVDRPSYFSTVTPGDYSEVSSFVTALTNTLRNIDDNFSVLYLEGTTKLKISNAFSPFRILLSDVVKTPKNIQSCIGLAYILGFRDYNDILAEFRNNVFQITSSSRIDLRGRQYMYLYLSNNDYYISNESSSRNKKNAFGRIVLAAAKGEVMYFMSKSHYSIEAETDINILNSLTIQLGRYAQMTNDGVQSSRDLLLYEPQGVEHSFCLKVTCLMDKQGSTAARLKINKLPDHLLLRQDLDISQSDDDDDLGNYY